MVLGRLLPLALVIIVVSAECEDLADKLKLVTMFESDISREVRAVSGDLQTLSEARMNVSA